MGDLTEDGVLVIGMGPVGMTAALALARRGIAVTVLEAGDDLATESRASTFHPPSLEILDELGVYDDLRAAGMEAARFQYRTRSGRVIADLDLGALAEDTRFPFRLQCEQSVLTRIIRGHLERLPHVTLRFNAPVSRVEASPSQAHVYLEDDGYSPSYTAAWVLAADGSNSAARRSLGIQFEGMTYPERFLVASTTHDFAADLPGLAPVTYIYDPEDWGVLLRTPREWRALFPIAPGESNEDALDPTTIERRLQGIVASELGFEVTHASIYAVHQRVAERFAEGRVLLIGDSAHINNPLGGLGMNSGIHDAHAAVEAVRYALAGGDPARATEVYSRVRRDAARHDVQRTSHKNYEQMRSSEAVDPRPDSAMAALTTDPVRARGYLQITSMLSSYSTSRRRMRWGLTPTHPPVPTAAAQVLIDSLRSVPHTNPGADRLAVAAWLDSPAPTSTDALVRLADGSREPMVAAAPEGLPVAEAVARFQRAGVAAISLTGSGDVKAAVEARRNLVVVAEIDASDPQQAAPALDEVRRLVNAGADVVAFRDEPSLEYIERVHRAIPSVPLAIRRSAPEPPDAIRLGLAGVCLLLRPAIVQQPSLTAVT